MSVIEPAGYLFHQDIETASFRVGYGSLVALLSFLTPKSKLTMIIIAPDIEKSKGQLMTVRSVDFRFLSALFHV
jgi:hypothetical protein